jgi:hypothetical protein
MFKSLHPFLFDPLYRPSRREGDAEGAEVVLIRIRELSFV